MSLSVRDGVQTPFQCVVCTIGDSSMIEKFKVWIKDVEFNAIERKKNKVRSKNNGDDSHWKNEIWPSPEKNKEIKLRFAIEGENIGYKPRPYKENKAGEWLYDLVWRKFDEDGNLLCVDLVMEIEMSDMNVKGIKYDFNKLLQADSKYKILVFQLKTEDEVHKAFSVFKKAAKIYSAKTNSAFLLCGWSTSKNSFYFDDFDVAV
jgi:hypothetical protein